MESSIDSGAATTALLTAAAQDHHEVVQVLLDRGVDVNSVDDAGQTALHYASRLRNMSMMQILIAAGADVNARDDDGWTPLTSTTAFQDLELSKLLIDADADPDITAHHGLNELYGAATRGDIDYARFLLNVGTGPWIRTRDRWTPFHSAAANGHEEIVRMLIEAGEGVGMNFVSDQKVTPLDLAMKFHQTRVSIMLAQAGAVCGDHVLKNKGLHESPISAEHRGSMEPVADGKKVFLTFDEPALTAEMRHGRFVYQPEENGKVYHLPTYLDDATTALLRICLASAPGMPREYVSEGEAPQSRISFGNTLFEVRRVGEGRREFLVHGGTSKDHTHSVSVVKSDTGDWKAYWVDDNGSKLFFRTVPDWTIQHAKVAAGKRIRLFGADRRLVARIGSLSGVPTASIEGDMSLEMQHMLFSCWMAILWSDTLGPVR